jgi:hypothetical protein
MEILIGALIVILIVGGLTIYNSFSWGYVASIIYQWFILSQFTNLPDIKWWQFSGIMFFINCFIHIDNSSFIKEEMLDIWKGLKNGIINPWITLLTAWIFKIILFN